MCGSRRMFGNSQTDRQTDMLSTILRSPVGGKEAPTFTRKLHARSSNDSVHPIVVWVVTKWSKVNTATTTAAGALMRDATKCL